MEEGVWDIINPHPNFTHGTITFDIAGDGDNYLDISQTQLWATVAIQKKDGSVVSFATHDNSKIGPVNNFLSSLFSQVQVQLNAKEIENSNSLYFLRSYIETLLGYNRESKETFVQVGGWLKDEAGNMAEKATKVETVNTVTVKTNSGLLARRKWFEEANPRQFRGRIHSDIFNASRYLLNKINVNLKMTRNKPELYLIGETADLTAAITDCFLKVRRVRPSQSVAYRHMLELEKNTAKYPIKRVIMKNYTLPFAASKASITGICNGVLPSRVILGLIKTDDLAGSLDSNPLYFRNYDVSNLVLKVSSKAVPYSSGLQLNYSKHSYLAGYNTLFEGVAEASNDITYAEYKNGYTLYAFNLTPDLCNAEHFNLIKEGSLDIELNFNPTVNVSVTAVFYLEFDNIIEINKYREVHLDYQI